MFQDAAETKLGKLIEALVYLTSYIYIFFFYDSKEGVVFLQLLLVLCRSLIRVKQDNVQFTSQHRRLRYKI